MGGSCLVRSDWQVSLSGLVTGRAICGDRLRRGRLRRRRPKSQLGNLPIGGRRLGLGSAKQQEAVYNRGLADMVFCSNGQSLAVSNGQEIRVYNLRRLT